MNLRLSERSKWFFPGSVVVAAMLFGASGCSSVGYYSQAVGGHLKLMRAREDIKDVIADESTSSELRQKLQTLLAAREFAVAELGLPDNDSYSTFVETGRAAVTWNVVAANEFSVNYDVTVGGASAYSTLGWFDDPVLDTMLRGRDTRYVGTLFHELAHQLLYVKDDSNFNEAFATFVEQQGTRQWLEASGEAERIEQYNLQSQRVEDFIDLLRSTRTALQTTFAKDLDEQAMREEKAAVFDTMRADYEELKEQWGGFSGYDNWFKRDLNNARLVAVSTYHKYVPAFYAMYLEAGEDLNAFYDVARVTADLPRKERTERLNAYLAALEATAS